MQMAKHKHCNAHTHAQHATMHTPKPNMQQHLEDLWSNHIASTHNTAEQATISKQHKQPTTASSHQHSHHYVNNTTTSKQPPAQPRSAPM